MAVYGFVCYRCDSPAVGSFEEAQMGADVETDSRERADEHAVYIVSRSGTGTLFLISVSDIGTAVLRTNINGKYLKAPL